MHSLAATLYTRHGCHLCDDAHALLRRYGFDITPVDIDADPRLRERYDECVPVVVVNGRERFRGKVSEVLLRRLVEASRETAAAQDSAAAEEKAGSS